MIESYILGFGFENDLLSAEKCAKTAREYRLEFERLTGIKLMGIEEE